VRRGRYELKEGRDKIAMKPETPSKKKESMAREKGSSVLRGEKVSTGGLTKKGRKNSQKKTK